MRLGLPAVVVLLLGVCASRAEAQGFGVRAGVSGSPDQFYVGLHYETDQIVDRLRFRPNLELGVGDNQTLVAANFEFAYRIPLDRNPWSVYVGAGPALVIDRFNPTPSTTNTGGGFNILIGLAHRGGLFTELKVGAINSPSVKFGIGYTFP